jgi:ABC-type dipeptide/oligopeptide/nickel transport system permease component
MRFVVSRSLAVVPVLLGVSLLVFLALNFLPGDAASTMMAGNPTSDEAFARIRQYMASDRPPAQQYALFVGRLLRGDLGWSLRANRPVRDMILANLGSTVALTLAGLGVAVVVGLVVGVLAAVRPNSVFDNVSMSIVLLGVSVPDFWLGLVLMFVFSVWLGWLPITGDGWLLIILPAVALGLPAAAVIARMMRSSMLEVLAQDYIRVAKAKGLAARAVLGRHALKNALMPVVTVVGLQFGRLMAGAVVIETVFARQGVGRLVVSAILEKDIPLVQGAVVFAAFWYVVANLTVDMLYTMLDPRVQFD